MTYIHILVYVSTLTGLIVQMVLTELMHNHVCETVNILTGLMHTMYICDNTYIHSTKTISDTEIGKMGEYASTQTLVIHQWAGPSVIAQLAPDSTPDRAE